jgi:L-alanine-DL-glutamate epimerase-like enolase superfamily enzyme
MRIVAVEVAPVAIPFITALESGAGRWSGMRSTIVALRTDSGVVGLGEMTPADGPGPGLPLVEVLPGLDLADDAAVEAALGAIDRRAAVEADAVAGRVVRSAVASAIVDALARAAGRSVASWLSPASRPDVAVNGLIGRVSPDEAATQARALVGAGLGCLKVKGGGESEDIIVTRLSSVRDAVGPGVTLRLDLNGSLEEAAAERVLRRLAPLEPEHIEQPIAADAGPARLAHLRASVGVPIAADESVTGLEAARALLEASAVDVLVVKPARVGGLVEARRIVELAVAAGVTIVVSTLFETGVGIAAALHLAATVPDERAHGLGTAGLLASDLLTSPLAMVDGRMVVPDGSGLGIELDEAAVDRYRVAAPAEGGPS